MSAVEPRSRRARRWALLVAAVVLLPRLAVETVQCAREVGPALEAAQRFFTLPPEALIQGVGRLSPGLISTLRERAPEGARVILFFALPGQEGENMLRLTFERLKNVVWPHPYRVAYARSPDDAQAKMTAQDEGRLLVVDMAEARVPQPGLPGRYELLYQDPLLRLWMLREVAR